MLKLNTLDHLPAGLLRTAAPDLQALLGGPTLIHLPGKRQPPLFVSVLLHGNETSGWQAAQRLLQAYQDRPLPRALSLFIGNVAAARLGLRRLDGQPDYNRVWPGGIVSDTPEHRLVQQVFDDMRARGVFASADLHNNTGLNPHYACVNRLDQGCLHLATLFGRTVVYFTKPLGVQSLAFAELAPAVTLECGQVGQARGVDHALAFLDACLHLDHLPSHSVPAHDIDLFHTVATVYLPPQLAVAVADPAAAVNLIADLDRLNFRELPAGTRLATVAPGVEQPLDVRDEHGREVGERFFRLQDGALLTRVPLMPSMLTLDVRIMRQDCLCYLMERIGVDYPLSPPAE